MGELFFAAWLFFMAALGWYGRKKQDKAPLNKWFRQRFGLDEHYYERVTTQVSIGAVVIGLFFVAKGLGAF